MRWNTLLLGRDDVIISGNIDRYLNVFVFVVEMIDILNTESINLDPEVLQNTNDYIVSRIPVGTHQENNGAVLECGASKTPKEPDLVVQHACHH